MSYDRNLQPKGSWAETCADKPGAGMHVVISTKYLDEGGGKGVYFDVSVRAKTALQALGCTVYNPNTDNKLGDKGWLISANMNLTSVAEKKGFVFQLQQGKARMKSNMQGADEMMAETLKGGMPKIGAYIPDNGEYSDEKIRQDTVNAIKEAKRQWTSGVKSCVVNVDEAGLYNAAKEAREVHLISTPYKNKAGAKKAREVRARIHKPPGVVCIDPNEDIKPIASDRGWSPAEQDKKWLEVFMGLLRTAQKKKKQGSKVHVICCNNKPCCDPDDGLTPELVGDAQRGELLAALIAGFNEEDGSMVYEIFQETPKA